MHFSQSSCALPSMIKELKIAEALGANISFKEAFMENENALLIIRLFTDIDDLQEILRMCGTRGFLRLTANPQTYQKK